ncbi:hypothetical protein D3C86_1532160 [compost metagenome]
MATVVVGLSHWAVSVLSTSVAIGATSLTAAMAVVLPAPMGPMKRIFAGISGSLQN